MCSFIEEFLKYLFLYSTALKCKKPFDIYVTMCFNFSYKHGSMFIDLHVANLTRKKDSFSLKQMRL